MSLFYYVRFFSFLSRMSDSLSCSVCCMYICYVL